MSAVVKNILVGLFIVLALAIITYMLLFLHPVLGDHFKTLRVRFTDIDKVTVGTRVTFAGRHVGEVVAIQEIPEARVNRIGQFGEIYAYELTLKVNSEVEVFNSDEIVLRTSGLLGERNIEINPRPLKPGEKLQNVDDEILYAAQTASVEDTMKQIGELSKKVDVVLEDVHDLLKQVKDQQVVSKVVKAVKNITEITEALNQPETWRQTLDNIFTLSEQARHSWTTVDQSLQNIHHLTERANDSWTTVDRSLKNVHHLTERAQNSWNSIDASLDNVFQVSQNVRHSWTTVDQTLQKFKAVAENTHAFTGKANQLLDYTLQGKGTLGQIVVGNDLYLRLKSILHKGETTMNDISHYGILFHLDKRWQRLQARRLRLLEKLSTPEEFARYFNQEMDQISSSLCAVSMILNESECYPQSLLHNPDFTQRFSDLLRRVENMQESLKMYNQQVIDQE